MLKQWLLNDFGMTQTRSRGLCMSDVLLYHLDGVSDCNIHLSCTISRGRMNSPEPRSRGKETLENLSMIWVFAVCPQNLENLLSFSPFSDSDFETLLFPTPHADVTFSTDLSLQEQRQKNTLHHDRIVKKMLAHLTNPSSAPSPPHSFHSFCPSSFPLCASSRPLSFPALTRR